MTQYRIISIHICTTFLQKCNFIDFHSVSVFRSHKNDCWMPRWWQKKAKKLRNQFNKLYTHFCIVLVKSSFLRLYDSNSQTLFFMFFLSTFMENIRNENLKSIYYLRRTASYIRYVKMSLQWLQIVRYMDKYFRIFLWKFVEDAKLQKLMIINYE